MKKVTEKSEAALYELAMLRKRVLQWLRDAMGAAGLSGAELGRRTAAFGLDLDKGKISSVLNGKRQLQAAEMLAIAEITGVGLPGADPRPRLGPDEPSPEVLLGLLAEIYKSRGFSDQEVNHRVEGLSEVARKLEGQRQSDDFSRSLRDQAQVLGVWLFPKRAPTEPKS